MTPPKQKKDGLTWTQTPDRPSLTRKQRVEIYMRQDGGIS